MKEFFKQLVTANSGISSKRFISLVCLVVYLATIIASWWLVVPEYAVWSLVSLILGGSVMTLAQKPSSTKDKENIL